MDQRVAVGAGPVEYVTAGCWFRGCIVSAYGMTALTQPRRADFQQLRIAGAVRIMAVHAVLHDWRMLPDERAAPFRVAFITGLIHGGRDEKFWIRASVRVVAVGAGNLPLPHRHMRRPLELRPAHGMALEANLHLRIFGEQPIVGQRLLKTCRCQRFLGLLVDLVARRAAHAPRLVLAPAPKQPLTFFVALQTPGALLPDRQRNILAETDDELRALWTLICRAGRACGVPGVLRRDMLARRPVASLATSGFKFIARGFEEYFRHLRQREFSVSLFMALLASITPGVRGRVRGLLGRLREQSARPTAK
jgi:hypothetical protein